MYPQGYCAAVFGHRRGKIIFGAFLVSVLGLVFTYTNHAAYLSNLAQPYLHPSVSSDDLTLFNPGDYERRIHLLVPVTQPNEKFCKTFFSSLVNGFPPPYLINYGEQFPTQQIARAMKIKGFHTYLNERTRPEDIVIMIDGFDVWFQLPLQVLLSRFLKMGNPAVFGADKKCWPNDFKSPACTAVPQSPLPADVFGDDTDRQTIMRSNRDKYDNFRPRWVNSGTIIGYAGHVRTIYEEAWMKVEAAGQVNSDQLILAEVYGDRVVKGDKSMTVDFYSSLFQTMTYSHNDIGFVRNPSEDTTSTTFSKTISNEKLPLEDLGLSASKSPNPNRSPWKSRNLAWNKVSNRIPTLLHFNGPKYFIDIWWPRMWYYSFGVKWTQRFKQYPSRAGAWVAGKEPGTMAWLTYESICGKERLFGEPKEEEPKTEKKNEKTEK
ncbi:hypothetical protein DRE_07266 [Drechslerella stenobrocha 248]|uniref:PLOD1-3-like GT domain-containing protein n=1 Tax=Drechslerella stenobrocha 248 TaxID=1043628 RepID=W7HUU8_9PEZI|nr:hypothetical protein DRE_07266 [Drechslerella stenobrocha 248]